MRKLASLVAVLACTCSVLGATYASGGTAISEPALQRCLENTNIRGVHINVQDLGLDVSQKREIEYRVAAYWSSAHRFNLQGVGLTASQTTTVLQRIAADVAKMTRYPVGWPCAPFVNESRTVAYVRALLVGNGFHSFSLRFSSPSSRQIQFTGVVDGYDYFGVVVKTGTRKIDIRIDSVRGSGAPDISAGEFSTAFDA